MLSHKGEAVAVTVEAGFMAVEAGFTAVEAGFTVAEAGFTVRVVSEGFMAEAFTAAGSQAFIEVALGAFTAGVSEGFTAMAVFSVPASMGMGTQGGGVIPIIGATRIIGVTRIIPTILIIPITRISRNCPGADSSNSFMRAWLPRVERVLRHNG
ncbi:MAG TPA: hypothetical protein VHS80_01375 [Chthoniobacterales bacterium]|nr:hypothetical protein [Chthoniobacterales bacterium]